MSDLPGPEIEPTTSPVLVGGEALQMLFKCLPLGHSDAVWVSYGLSFMGFHRVTALCIEWTSVSL